MSSHLQSLAALITVSVEIGHMTFDITAKILCGNIGNAINTVHGQVDHSAAVAADEVIMRTGIGVEMIHSISQPEPLDLTDICQQGQVTVDRTETDVGILLSDIHVDNVGCRVVITFHQKVFDHVALFTML